MRHWHACQIATSKSKYELFILIRNKYVFWGTEIKTSERIPHTLVATFYIHTIII